jgi:WD40 repeat protein
MRYGLGTLRCAAYSPDGKTIATGGGIGAVLWDARTGDFVRILSAPGHYVYSVAFSPDGTKVLTGSYDATAKLWDTATGAEIRTFTGHTWWPITSVAFSPDGTKVLTGSWDQTAKLWDAATGAEIRIFEGHTDDVWSVAFSLDGTKVLTGSRDKTAKLWNASTGAEIQTFAWHTWNLTSVAFSPDGTKILTGSVDETAKLWDVSTGAEIRTLLGHTSAVFSVAFSPDGTKVLTGSYDATAKLWDTSTGAEIRTFSGHTSYVYSVAFSPDGTKVLTGGNEGLTILWDSGLGNRGPQPPPVSQRKLDKIILVAGGGPYTGNSISAQTEALAELTYLTATIRGYTPANIYYLSAFDTPATDAKVDGAASSTAIEDAITDWARDASRLTIWLIDHGHPRSGGPRMVVFGERNPFTDRLSCGVGFQRDSG